VQAQHPAPVVTPPPLAVHDDAPASILCLDETTAVWPWRTIEYEVDEGIPRDIA